MSTVGPAPPAASSGPSTRPMAGRTPRPENRLSVTISPAAANGSCRARTVVPSSSNSVNPKTSATGAAWCRTLWKIGNDTASAVTRFALSESWLPMKFAVFGSMPLHLMTTSSCGLGTGRERSRTPCTSAKMAVAAPTPSPSDVTATMVKTGLRRSCRTPKRMSLQRSAVNDVPLASRHCSRTLCTFPNFLRASRAASPLDMPAATFSSMRCSR